MAPFIRLSALRERLAQGNAAPPTAARSGDRPENRDPSKLRDLNIRGREKVNSLYGVATSR